MTVRIITTSESIDPTPEIEKVIPVVEENFDLTKKTVEYRIRRGNNCPKEEGKIKRNCNSKEKKYWKQEN
ncbi:MAG: hypothetical protein ACR2IS_10350 [Nitrososphaeraceae archaeon]